MLTMILVSMILLTMYLLYAFATCGNKFSSVSDTYYQLERHGRPRWLFQVAMIVPAFLLLPPWLEASAEGIEFLPFLCCAGLIFVGAAPLFKVKIEGRVHHTAAIIAGGSSMAWSILAGHPYAVGILFAIGLSIGILYKRWLLWLELAAFVWTYHAVICETIKM